MCFKQIQRRIFKRHLFLKRLTICLKSGKRAVNLNTCISMLWLPKDMFQERLEYRRGLDFAIVFCEPGQLYSIAVTRRSILVYWKTCND